MSSRDLRFLREELRSLGHVVPHWLPREQRRLKLPTPTRLITDPESAAPNPAADLVGVPLWKRALDICCVVFAGATLLPMFLLIAIAIKLGSKGPVLFKQERVGLLGKSFMIFKFRTMVPGADTAVHETHAATLIESNTPMTKLDARGDARIVPFGRLLRAACLDELPQLINVLRGEMSIVGPRPCVTIEYNKYLPRQTERFLTPPGLTGLWQVSGKNRTTFNEMIDLDIQYVRERSLWLDLMIILKTIPAVMAEVRDMQRPRRQSRLATRTLEASPFIPDSNPEVDWRLSGHELTSVKGLGGVMRANSSVVTGRSASQ
jgi:lipopolysaccharide/colanic/teichoic acid biosynthesis glycosyltransferase